MMLHTYLIFLHFAQTWALEVCGGAKRERTPRGYTCSSSSSTSSSIIAMAVAGVVAVVAVAVVAVVVIPAPT